MFRPRINIGRRLLARAAIVASLASAAGGALASNVTHAGATTYTVTLRALPTATPTVGTQITVEAEVSPNPNGTGLHLTVYDEDTHSMQNDCLDQWLCDVQEQHYTNTPHHYMAYLASSWYPDPPTGIVAQSSLLTVTWGGTFTWTESLSASTITPEAGTSTTLTATANGYPFEENYSAEIDDLTTGAAVQSGCMSNVCRRILTSSVPGTHQYQAKLRDSSGNVLATSGVVTVTWLSYYSDQCTSPLITAVDGWFAGTYARVKVQQVGNSTLVCYRLDQGSTLDGGQLLITASGVSVGLPSIDNSDTACANITGNQVPGPHPLETVTTLVGNFSIDTYLGSGSTTAWVCLTAGPLHQRIVVPVSETGGPTIVKNDDPVGQQPPAPAAGPAGYPSSSCVASGGSAAVQYVDATVGTTHEWLSAWQDGASNQVDVCARLQTGAASEGGLFTVSEPSISGGLQVTPVFNVGTDGSACSVVVAGVGQPPTLQLATTPAGSNPATVCASAAGTTFTVTVGAITSSPPVQFGLPGFTPDPDSVTSNTLL